MVGGPNLGQKRGTKQLMRSPVRLTIENWVASAWRHSDTEESHKSHNSLHWEILDWVWIWCLGIDIVFVLHGLGGVVKLLDVLRSSCHCDSALRPMAPCPEGADWCEGSPGW